MNIQKLIDATETTKAAYTKACESGSFKDAQAASQKHSEARKALLAAIVVGANPCPSCGAKPHGMVQNFLIEKEVVVGFEVGCLNCYDHLAVGYLAEEFEDRQPAAVKKWNAGPDKWYRPAGNRSRLEPHPKTGEVMLVFFEAPDKPATDKVSCKVVAASDAEIAAYAKAKGFEDLAHAAVELFKERIAQRNARVRAFREKHGIETGPTIQTPSGKVETVA